MKVAVIGDVMIDRYIYGTAERISPEAPVPIIKHLKTKERFGGAGNLLENLKSLGVDVTYISASNHRTSLKTRVFCDGHYVTRIDQDYIADGDSVYENISKMDFSEYAYVVLSDYNKGTLSRSRDIIKHINRFGCKVIVDPKRTYDNYVGAWLIKANEKEAKDFKYGNMLYGNNNIIVTRAGERVDANIDGERYMVDVEKVEVSDVTGAGDCFLAAFVWGLTQGRDISKCLVIATNAATESVKHPGTYILKPEDLKHTTVFTNGCFDILHRGHIEYLQQSKKLGNKLIVGINSDESVRKLKGPSRPINNQEDRATALSALSCVDAVFVFDEDTPYDLIRTIKPDIITKGGDYKPEEVVGNDLADVVILPYVKDYSTTNIVSKLNDET